MADVVRIIQLNYGLELDVKAQYVACGSNLAIFASNFNLVSSLFALMITYSFLNSSVPTSAPRCLLLSLAIFKFVSLNIPLLFHIFLASQLVMICLTLENILFLDQKYSVSSTKLVYPLVFLHILYHLHKQHVLCFVLLSPEEILAYK